MKKLYAMFAVVALVCISSMAFAVDVTVGGSMDIRSRNFRDLDFNKNVNDSTVDTQERVRLDINVKAGDVKGKVTIENDWDTFGRFDNGKKFDADMGTTTVATGVTNTTTGTISSSQASRLALREAWMLFPVPETPVNVKAGHMLLQLGQGWWFRSMKYGSDAWVAYTDIDALHLALVNVKISEGVTSKADDVDAYVVVAAMKVSEDMKFGADITLANDRRNTFGFGTPGAVNPKTTEPSQAYDIGLNADVKAGPVGLKAEVDVQTGKAKGNDAKFKGNQIVIQGNVPMDPVTINFTLASGSGQKIGEKDYKQMVTFLDTDPHYTFLYEYKVAGPCGISTGFCDTTAISAGALFAATKSLSIGADVWFLQATQKVLDKTSVLPAAIAPTTSELGTEVDVKINWKLADNLTWNWSLGYLDPGKGLGKDPATGAQGVLSMKF